jgi:hypothetical protein
VEINNLIFVTDEFFEIFLTLPPKFETRTAAPPIAAATTKAFRTLTAESLACTETLVDAANAADIFNRRITLPPPHLFDF